MRRIFEDYAEDFISGLITSIVALFVIRWAQQWGLLTPLIINISAFVLFLNFLVMRLVFRYAFFVISEQRSIRGLFVEFFVAEIDREQAVIIAPKVVCFRLLEDKVAINGIAYRVQKVADSPSGLRFEPYAKWRSLTVDIAVRSDEFSVSYLHDGQKMTDEQHDDIPGVTYCELPKPSSAQRTRRGYFCDLDHVRMAGLKSEQNQFEATRCELYRADQFYTDFRDSVGAWHRKILWQWLGIAPAEDDFQRFMNEHGARILDAPTNPGHQLVEIRIALGRQT